MILAALKAASKTLNLDLTITSGTDGVHSGPGDVHHRGEAYDVRSHDFQASFVEAALARSDRRMARAIHRAWQLGTRFDGWRQGFDYGAWSRAWGWRSSGIPNSSASRRMLRA